jgi:ABC-type cobalamin/Fe3+-siderophores transport system ATPase subunit
MKSIQIPSAGLSAQEIIKIEKNIIIVGANGAGKTRFGSKLEQLNSPSKRISAQRYLQLSEVVQRQDFETASTQLNSSYKNQPSIQPQNDYQQVLVSLFAQESRRDFEYVASSRSSEVKIEIPQSVKERVIDVWNFVFPNRELRLEKDRVRAVNESNEFSGSEMSDGEKVSLYLISQILLAEENCILIIDEPELHLHKALMTRLWNKLEEYRVDCTFIYITHDLDFAVSKPSSKLIWIQSYKNNIWDWKEIDSNKVIPENLFLEILGSKKAILFVEGDKGSLDIQIYQAYYENFTVIPCGTCEKVIEAVKGLKTHSDLHDKKVYGLIDKDFRTEEHLNSLKSDGVFSIVLNEVENLFLAPEIIEMICNYQFKIEKKEEIIREIKKIYAENRENLFFSASKYRIYRHLKEKIGMVKNINDYDEFKKTIISELEHLTVVDLPQNDSEIIEILKAYPHKGLVSQIQGKIELSKNGYKRLVLSLLSSNKRSDLIDIFKLYLPEIS